MPDPDATLTLDQVYAALKQHDKEWLETVLRQRHEDNSQNTHVAQVHRPVEAKPQWMGVHDVTAEILSPECPISDHVRQLRAHNWANTDLGPMREWSIELRRLVNLCITDPRPVALWWGPQRLGIFNAPYTNEMLGRGRGMLGQSIADVWPEVMDGPIGRAFDHADATGLASHGDSTVFFVERDGIISELWASWSIVPILGHGGNIAYYNSASDDTRQVMYERRMATLLALERKTAPVAELGDFWSHALAGLEHNKADVPFAAIYSSASPRSQTHTDSEDGAFSETSSDISSNSHAMQWTLEGVIKSESDDFEMPAAFDLETDQFSQLFKSAITSGNSTLLQVKDGTFPRCLLDRVTSRAYGAQCTAAVLLPIWRARKRRQSGFLLMALNPRHAYDSDYQHFVSLLRRQLNTSFASVLIAEDDARHARMASELADRERVQLSEKLAFSEHEAKDNELRFQRMADHAPVAMFQADGKGVVLYANRAWKELTGHNMSDRTPTPWIDAIHEADRDLARSQWQRVLAGEPINYEVRFKRPYITDELVNGEPLQGDTWMLVAAYVEKHADGSLRDVLGVLVDISRQKWMATFQERRHAEALERKRQTENFMDMTSHEARNPLAAIMLCGESIIETFRSLLKASGERLTISRDTVVASLNDADIIMACAQHQKHIIDDVLTLSKLDSGLLVVAPEEVQPLAQVSQALDILRGEIKQADIDLRQIVTEAYRKLAVDWVMLDPARLLQILINLITNSIKFTKDEATRRITVTLDASAEPPTNLATGAQYLEDAAGKSPVQGPNEPDVFVSISVEDTGRGIQPDELSHLFNRFQQASPRTHVQYGGSGLGLFISRELARLQGGRIGVASKFGAGSTFIFYVATTRCAAPGRTLGPARDKSSAADSSKGSGSDTGAIEDRKEDQPVSSDRQDEKIHILLVEDNLVNQKVMARQLERNAFQVDVANHGQEALEFLSTTQFAEKGGVKLHVILMDVEMPVLDGISCAREIRQMEADSSLLAHVPIIAVTANARAEQRKLAIDAGMDAVVTKPFRMEELLAEIERLSSSDVHAPVTTHP